LGALNPFLLLFVALAVASIAWSIAPEVTVRRDIRLITILAVCIAFSLAGWHARRFQNVLRPALTLVLLGSVVFGLAAPALAIHQELAPELGGAWRGLANHKNTFGAIACATLILWLHAWMAGETRTWRALCGCALAAACLALSSSSTAMISAIAGGAVLLLLLWSPRSAQPYMKYLIAFAMLVLVIYALAILRLIPGLSLLLAPITLTTGIDMTFTGRSEIWALIVERIQLNPLLGVGYGAYWIGPVPESPSYEFIWRMGSFYPGSAHNGYLDVANDLGGTGLLCLLGYIVVHLRQSLRMLVADKPLGALFLALFLQQALVNLSESHWFNVLSLQFALMTLATAALARRPGRAACGRRGRRSRLSARRRANPGCLTARSDTFAGRYSRARRNAGFSVPPRAREGNSRGTGGDRVLRVERLPDLDLDAQRILRYPQPGLSPVLSAPVPSPDAAARMRGGARRWPGGIRAH
jgi:O-antigen ligase